uniref:Myb/SANT-like domain-containing protein n=1 Tax=Peronospora matthiolae TaxID=2874970 RepID=A0AAV1UHC5_9STRA
MPRGPRRDGLDAPPRVIAPSPPPSPRGPRGTSSSVPSATTRQRFGQQEDFLLLQQVQRGAPYKAQHGTIQRTWDRVAEQLNAHPDFHMRLVKGSTVKARFDTLLSRHRERVGGRAMGMQGEGRCDEGEGEGGEEREGRERRRRSQRDGPFWGLMAEVVKQIDEIPAKEGDRTLLDGSGGRGDARGDRGYGLQRKRVYKEEEGEEEKASCRLGRHRGGSSGAGVLDGERWRMMARDGVDARVSSSLHVRDDSVANGVVGRSSGGVEDEAAGGVSLPGGRETPDLATVQQAMGELLKMQHVLATRPSEGGLVTALGLMNEARLREEEEKTKQRDLELLVEKQRTKRRQMELDFERNERKKDREEQAKLIASLLERLQSAHN